MRRHHGDIAIETAEDEGTTVRLVLPLQREQKTTEKTYDQIPPYAFEILCVDDDQAVAALAAEIISSSAASSFP